MRILLAISTLGAGGAERVITTIANELARRSHDVTLLTLDRVDAGFYVTDASVSRIGLDLIATSSSIGARVKANLLRVSRVRSAIARFRPDAVVSFITEMNVTAILACLGMDTPVVVSERIDPREHSLGRAWSLLRRATYRHARLLVVQTPDVASWCLDNWSVAAVVAIPNPVAETATRPSPRRRPARPFLLAVGRLDRQKGFDILLRAFALLAPHVRDLDLCIVGEGPESSRLRSIAKELAIQDRLLFPGQVHDVEQLMADAFAFVLPSRYEGFPNVLLEALARGAATIAADCRSGPRQILQGGRFGLLVPPGDAVALSGAIRQLWADSALLERLRANASEAVRPYSIETVLDTWEETLARAVRP